MSEEMRQAADRVTANEIRPGVYRHYKGPLYRVLFIAWESTNGRERRPVVVYVSLDEHHGINVRDAEEFSEYIDGNGTARFEWVRQ